MIKNLISNIDQIEDETLKQIIEQEEKEIKEIKLKIKNLDNVKVERMKIIKQKPVTKPNKMNEVEKVELTRVCIECKLE